jgi:hypothetical protein
MRWASLWCCYLLLALSLAGASTPLLAADLGRQTNPDDRSRADKQEELAEFCYEQRQICRRICRMRSRFEDRFDGCPSSCESREMRCSRTGCYRWSEPEFILAENFGGYRCPQGESAGLPE